jgi:dephospho-CoA kinase
MTIVGLTGVMGSGKSFISEIFAKLGAYTYNTDMVSKMVQEKNQELRTKIIEKFGEKYYDGKVINKKFAIPLLYSGTPESIENAKWMTATVGEYVLEHLNKFKELKESTSATDYILVESAILFETGFDKYCDYVIGVKSTNPINATYTRDWTTKEEWVARMASQLPDSEKNFDFMIGNDYTNAVEAQVELVHKQILEKIS